MIEPPPMMLLLSSGSPSYRIWPPPAILASSCSDACTSMSPPPATLHSAFRRTHPKALISPPPATLRSPLSASPLSRMEPLPATLQSRLSTFSWVALISPDPATLKLILRASSCLSKFIVLLPAILISSLSALRGLLDYKLSASYCTYLFQFTGAGLYLAYGRLEIESVRISVKIFFFIFGLYDQCLAVYLYVEVG